MRGAAGRVSAVRPKEYCSAAGIQVMRELLQGYGHSRRDA